MKESKKLPLIYIIGMPIIYIIINAIAKLHINILGSSLYLSVLLFQVIFLISGLIIKKSNYKSALTIMAVSLVSVALSSVVQWAVLNIASYWIMVYSFLSFLICSLIFIYIYDFLIKTEKDTYIPVLILLAVVNMVDGAFFGAIVEGNFVSLSILLRIMGVVIIPIFLAKNTSNK